MKRSVVAVGPTVLVLLAVGVLGSGRATVNASTGGSEAVETDETFGVTDRREVG